MELGSRLRQARLDAGLSQRQLCGDVITRNMLSQIENGAARPSMDTLQYLASQLGKPVSFFLEENAVLSENQAVMERSRAAFAAGSYSEVLAILKDYRFPDPVFDAEEGLMQTLSLLALAEEAAAQNRLPYARELLAQAQQALGATPYRTAELERRMLLLAAQIDPDSRDAALAALPVDDRELLLRAESALAAGDYPRCAELLQAAGDRSCSRWCYLRGEAAFGTGDYRTAAEYYKQAEKELSSLVCPRLEQCYLHLEDYKMAYEYACKQKNA